MRFIIVCNNRYACLLYTSDFVKNFVSCLKKNQSDEDLIKTVNVKFGTEIEYSEFQKLMQSGFRKGKLCRELLWNHQMCIRDSQLLAKEFNVSINELLAGQKMSDEEFRKNADENIIARCV